MGNEYEKTIYFQEENKFDRNNLKLVVVDGNSEPQEIRLRDFGKRDITFGRNPDNDIVLKSKFVSRYHGTIHIRNQQIIVKDQGSKNLLIMNGMLTKKCILREGDVLRIDHLPQNELEGVMFYLSAADRKAAWHILPLNGRQKIVIGRNDHCDIILNHVGVSKIHASIEWNGKNYELRDHESSNGTFVNGRRCTKVELNEKDLIIITNAKLIFTKEKIYYCYYSSGIGIDAQHLVRTVTNKGKRFNICNDVSLTVEPGELVAIIGGSGAGKTTLMNAICGYNRPTSGVVMMNGMNLYQSYDILKNIIGYVPQQDIVYDNLTLFQMLDYAAKLRLPDDITADERKRRVQTVIDMVELTGKENTMIRRLSGGQKKRASIAVELLPDPGLFFLDEPASGLDPGTEYNLMWTLKKMAEKGKTVILVTHSILNLDICDKVVFMGRGGNLCFCGNLQDAGKFFNVKNLVKIYNMISDRPGYWKKRYLEQMEGESIYINSESGTNQLLRYKRPRRNPVRQTIILSKRYLHLMLNDRQRTCMILLQAPILAFLISLVKDGTQFEQYGMTKSLLFALSCSAFWIGILNSIQEICKERNILRREYMTGLYIGPYILLKVLVLGLFCAIQALLLTGMFSFRVGVPDNGVVMFPSGEMFLTAFMTAFSAACMGLFASALFKNPDRAMTIAPVMLMPQVLFSGLLFELKGVTKVISWFAVCRWSMEGFGTTADLNGLKYMVKINGEIQEVIHKAEDFFEHTGTHMWKTWGILAAFVVGFSVISNIVLRNIKRAE